MNEKARILSEILCYIKDNNEYSYNSLKEYAFREKNEWLDVFNDRNSRAFISKYLKSKKRKDHARYKTTACEAMENCIDAGINYYDKIRKIDK